jgi:kynurenine formamidase
MKIIDLSHTIHSDMLPYPGDDAPSIQKSATHEKDNVQVTRLGISTHTGTHLDTPRHFVANGGTTDSIDLDSFYGKGVLIDCRDFGQHQQILLSHISKFGDELKGADFALIYTGWYHHWETEKYFDHFPVLSVEAAKFLVGCNLKGIGMDFSSIDGIDSSDYPNHNLVLGKGLIIIENLTNLGQLAEKEFQFAAFPLKVHEGDGSPVRAVAFIGN